MSYMLHMWLPKNTKNVNAPIAFSGSIPMLAMAQAIAMPQHRTPKVILVSHRSRLFLASQTASDTSPVKQHHVMPGATPSISSPGRKCAKTRRRKDKTERLWRYLADLPTDQKQVTPPWLCQWDKKRSSTCKWGSNSVNQPTNPKRDEPPNMFHDLH